ncbi:unnamed protein product [Aphanomyces euteiches]
MWRRSVTFRALAQRSLAQGGRLKAPMPHSFPIAQRWISSHSVEKLQKCASTGNWKAALNVLAELDKAGETNAEAYELAIEALGRDQKFEAMESLLETMQYDGVVPTSPTIDMMVQAHLVNKNSAKIISLVTDRLRENEPVSLAAFHSAITECSELGNASNPEAILDILRTTRDSATVLTADEYAALIRCFGICKRSDLSMHSYYLMKENGVQGNIEVFTQLIRSHISVGAVQQAMHVFSMCDQQGIVLDESIHAATIGKLCERKSFWLACELFATMEAKGVHASPYCIAKMILAYIRTNNLSAAYAMWHRIQEMNPPANISTYMGIMHDCIVTGELDLLLEAFADMQEKYKTLPNVAYSFAIRGYGRQGNMDGALRLMDEYVQMYGPPTEATNYIAVFNALARSGECQDPDTTRRTISHYWDMMVKHVNDLQAPAYASAAGAFASNGDIVELEKLLEHSKLHLPESEALMYSGAISGFAKSDENYSEHIVVFLKKMADQGIPLNDAAVRAASDSFVKYERWNDIEDLLHYMEPKAFAKPQGVIGDVLSKLLEVDNWSLARKVVDASLAWDIQPHIRSKPLVLQKLADNKDGDPQWKIAYNLALETVSFATINEEHVYAVCNAMKVLFRAERHNLVARLWYALKVKNQLPLPIDAYKCIVLSSLSSGFEKAANTAADEMLNMLQKYHADIVDTSDVSDVFSVIISAFAQHGQDEMVLRLFESMDSIGLRANGYAYLAALRTHAEVNNDERVAQLLDSFEDYMSASPIDPSVMNDTLCSLVSHYAQSRNDKMVLSVFELMQSFQLEPNSYAYNAAIRAYSRRRRLDKVSQLQDELATSPSHVHYRVVDTILKSHLLAKDVSAIEQTIVQFNCKPDDVLTTLFHGHQVHPVATFMKSQGPLVEKRPTQLSLPMQTKGLKWLLSRDATAQAADVALFLLQNGYRVQSHVFESLLDQLSLEGAYDVGTMLLDAFNHKRSMMNSTTGVVDSMLTMMGNARQYDEIRDLFLESSQMFDVQQYGLGMFLCMDGGKFVHVLKIFEKLRQRFIEPDGKVFCLAIDSCHALQDTRVAKLIVQDIVRHKFEGKVVKELHTRLKFALSPNAIAIDPTLVERVGALVLFLEDAGFPVPASVTSKLLARPALEMLSLRTRTRIHCSLQAMNRQKPFRPWWKVNEEP